MSEPDPKDLDASEPAQPKAPEEIPDGVHLTDHGRQRMRERLSLSGDAAQRAAQRAYDAGWLARDARGKLRRYLDGLFLKDRTRNAQGSRIYGDWVWVFDGKSLVTVWPIPNGLKSGLRKLRARR